VTFIVIVRPFNGFNTKFTRYSTALCLQLQQVTFKLLICIHFICGGILSNHSFTQSSRRTSKKFFWGDVRVVIGKQGRCNADGTALFILQIRQVLPTDFICWKCGKYPCKVFASVYCLVARLWRVRLWTAIEIRVNKTTQNSPAAYPSWLLRNCPAAPVVSIRGFPTALFLTSNIYSCETADQAPSCPALCRAGQHISIRRGFLTALL